MFCSLILELVTQVSSVVTSSCVVRPTDMHFSVGVSFFNLNKKFVFSESKLSRKRKNLWKFASFSESVINRIAGLGPYPRAMDVQKSLTLRFFPDPAFGFGFMMSQFLCH